MSKNSPPESDLLQDPACPVISPREAEDLLAEGAAILDTRESVDYGLGHIPGSWNVQLSSPHFEERVSWISKNEQSVLLVVDEPGKELVAVRKLFSVGLDRSVVGVVDLVAWRAEGREQNRLPQIDVRELSDGIGSGELQLLDVREDSEWSSGHIDGAFHRPLARVAGGVADLALDPERPLAVICLGGFRSSTACSLLAGRGFTSLCNVTGGMEAWKGLDLPVVAAGRG